LLKRDKNSYNVVFDSSSRQQARMDTQDVPTQLHDVVGSDESPGRGKQSPEFSTSSTSWNDSNFTQHTKPAVSVMQVRRNHIFPPVFFNNLPGCSRAPAGTHRACSGKSVRGWRRHVSEFEHAVVQISIYRN